MSHGKVVHVVWIVLVALTLVGAWLGEAAEPGPWVALIVIVSMAVKGRLVIDHFLELATCNRRIRRLMRAYFYVLPGLALATYLYGDAVVRMTTLR
ncbi:MAG TPA: cytochrome C oxidase subunit IV family protein [Rhodocyclaceae bacterium]|nr:cytochrome C oxidase subunit IV family protein [Rhodocyclaceae bacterium]